MSDQKFLSALPPAFKDYTISLCGESGRQWLATLPDRIALLESKWSITAEKSFQHLTYNYVCSALKADGTHVVLKIGLPLDDVEIFGEAKYLQTIDGCGAVKLLAFDRESQAMMLERIMPGMTLKSVCENDQARSVGIAIDLLKSVLRPIPGDRDDLIVLDDWFGGLKRYAGTDFPQEYAEKALTFYSTLSTDTANIFLIHGDLHHENILASDREPFLLIDPKGIIGHLGYDIGVFLNNHHNWLEWDTKLEGKLDRAVAEFAAAFKLEECVIRKWAFCQMVLSWWWIFDEMPEMFDGGRGLTEVWKV